MTRPARAASTALYVFSTAGLALARRIAAGMAAGGRVEIFAPARLQTPGVTPFSSIHALLAATFGQFRRHVFVGAAGIAVRAIAPHLRNKAADPAVAVLDQEGRFAISLVSGHMGGANELARELARLTGAAAVITTGTDAAGLPAVDQLAVERGMAVANLPAAKAVSAALLEGRPVQIFDPEGRLFGGDDAALALMASGGLVPTAPEGWEPAQPGVWCHWRSGGEHPATFRVYPPCLHLGLGCRKGAAEGEILAHIRTVFAREALAEQCIARVGTADIKRDDPGLCAAMQALGAEVVFYEAEALAAVQAAGQSETVRRRVGTGSVCEAAALLLAEVDDLIIPKTKTERVTLAVALGASERNGL